MYVAATHYLLDGGDSASPEMPGNEASEDYPLSHQVMSCRSEVMALYFNT